MDGWSVGGWSSGGAPPFNGWGETPTTTNPPTNQLIKADLSPVGYFRKWDLLN
jgi:hypothetical protein